MGYEITGKLDSKPFGEMGNLKKELNSYIIIENDQGFNSIGVRVNAPTGGEVAFEASFDGINWTNITLRSLEDDIFAQFTNDHSSYIGSISATRYIRFRTSIAGLADGDVIGSLNKFVNTLEGVEFGYPPHRFGFMPVHKDAQFTTQQTGTAIWTPATGKRMVITDLDIICSGNTDASVTIFDETNTSGNILFNGTINVSTNNQYNYVKSFKTPFISSAINNKIKLTTSAAIVIDITMHGYEI